MIRNNLIIQGFERDKFALENRIENPNHFDTWFDFGGMRCCVRLSMETDHYCHLLASEPHDHDLSLSSHTLWEGRKITP